MKFSAVPAASLLSLQIIALDAGAAAPGNRTVGCLVQPAQHAAVGSPVVGVIDTIAVEPGQQLKAGQVLVTLNSQVEVAALRVAEVRAKVTADVLAAEANVTLANQRLQRALQLESSSYIAEQTVDQLRAEADIARQQLQQVRDQHAIRQEELKLAQTQLSMRTVRSPFNGIVVERFMEPGERVEEKPILRLARVNPLRVDLMVPATGFGAYKPGDPVTVRPELPGVEPVVAKVVRADRVLDAASNTFRVELTLPNPDNRLPAGLRCRVDAPAMDQAALKGTPPPVAARPAK